MKSEDEDSPTKTISDRKRKANQENSRSSTGPKTETGAKNSSRNAVKHGILCRNLINPDLGERKEDFEAVLNAYREMFEPVGLIEEHDVLEITEISWRLKRVFRAEDGEISKGFTEHFWGMLQNRRLQFERDRVEWEVMRARRKSPLGKDESKAERVRNSEEIIHKLKTTTDGVDFVIGGVQLLKMEIEQTRTLSSNNHTLLSDYLGMGAMDLLLIKSEEEISYEEDVDDEESIKLKLQLIRDYIDGQLSDLQSLRQYIETINGREVTAARLIASLPSPTASGHLLRYETHLERMKSRLIADLDRRQMRRKSEHQGMTGD